MSTVTLGPAGQKNDGNDVPASSKIAVPASGGGSGGNAASQKAKKKHFNTVTPTQKQISSIKTSLDHRMTVEKNVVDELLLVCGVIGTTTNEGNELVPVTDCLNWLQDLQRALRRDEDLYRPISLLLGKWKVVQQKLLPLVLTCRYDTPIVLTVVKILVILTKPLADNTKRAGCMIIDTTSNKADPAVAVQQIKLRENALAQAEQLMEYKRMIAYHPSHHKKSRSSSSGKKEGSGLLSIIVSLLAEPLSKSGAARSDAHHLTIELVLHLIRNLLTAEPLLNTSSETSRQSHQLHQDTISLFDRELVLEILLVVGQEMELRENAQYNLLMMEILHHIFKSQDPMAVAKSAHQQGDKEGSKEGGKKKESGTTVSGECKGGRFGTSSSSSSSFLLSKLKQEQSQSRNITGVRHGHFAAGGLQRKQAGKLVGLEAVAGSQTQVSANAQRQTQSKRRNRMAEPFIGSGKTLLAHTALHSIDTGGGPSTKRANVTLHAFCQRFVEDCYGPFIKSLKNEFRRDSHRLEEADKVVFFRLVWFFSQWWRVTRGHGNKAVGRLIITMDVFTFNLVLNSADTFCERKSYGRLAQTVALYSEMMHLLYDMHASDDSTDHEMAMGLLDRLFYHGQDTLDRLPRLLTKWTPGTCTREYLCDLVELCHMSMKLLEANKKKGIQFLKTKGAQSGRGTKDLPAVNNKIAKMRSVAAEFDVNSYFLRKIVSNQTVIMCVHLLSQYKINSPIVNHRIISMFLRIMRLEIASPEVADEEMPLNPLGSKRVTLEPMLYNLPMITVMEQILNDAVIRKDKNYESLLQFCTKLMHNFWTAADANPLLYVESLFRHAVPHRFCEAFTNSYVDEDLRMMALRDILREEQERNPEEYGIQAVQNNDDDDDDDEELEFTGDGVRAETADEALATRASSKKRKKDATDSGESDGSDEEDANDANLDQDDKEESKEDDESSKKADNDDLDVEVDDNNKDGEISEASPTTENKRERDDIDDDEDGEDKKDTSQPVAKQPRLSSLDEDSSDDEFSSTIISTEQKQEAAAKPPRWAIEDDDDDE